MTRRNPLEISTLLIAAAAETWAMHEPTLQALQSLLVRHATGDEQISDAELASIAAAEARGGPKSPSIEGRSGGGGDGREGWTLSGSVAHIPVGGVIARYSRQVNGNSQPRGTSVEGLRTAIAQVRMDPKVRSAVLHIDSPGGSVSGLATLSEDLRGLRSHLEGNGGALWAFGDGLVASAAYWIGAQASKLLAEPGASVGSIGVYSLAMDDSQWYQSRGLKLHLVKAGKDKGIGAPGQAITPEQLNVLQGQVNAYFEMFKGEVARGRGMSAEAVDRVATGNVWIAEQARAMGLVDDISPNVESVVSRMEELFGSKAKGNNGSSGGSRAGTDAGVLPVSAGVGGGMDAGAAAPQEDDPMKGRMLMEAAGGVNGGGGGGGTATQPAATPSGNTGGGAGGSGDAGASGLDRATIQAHQRDIQERARPWAGNAKVVELRDKALLGVVDGTYTPDKFSAEALKIVGETGSAPMNSVTGGGKGQGVGGMPIDVGSDGRDRFNADMGLVLMSKFDPGLEHRLSESSDDEKGRAGGDAIAEAIGFAKGAEARAAIAKARRAFGPSRMRLDYMLAASVAMAAGCDYGHVFNLTGGDPVRLLQLAGNYQGNGGIVGSAGVTTSDFPKVLQNVMHKTLMGYLAEEMPKWRMFARKGSHTDYRPKNVYCVSEAGNLEAIGERETPTFANFNERKEAASLQAFARRFGLTAEMLRNDDLGVFQTMLAELGRSVARVPDMLLLAMLMQNSGLGPTLSDGLPLIDAGHKNVLANAALAYASLVADYGAFGDRVGFGPDTAPLDIEPAILLVRFNQKLLADSLLNSPYEPGKANQEKNVLAGAMQPVAWKRLTTNRRWIFADPNRYPVFEVLFMDGNEGVRVDTLPMNNPREMAWQVTNEGIGVGCTGQHEAVASSAGG